MLETIESLVTILFAALALLAGVGFVVFRQPVYAALAFAATVLSAAVLYILQDASYVAAATMVIYAGATIIIFLFVLMFAQHSHLQPYELKYSNLGPAIVSSIALVLLLGYAVGTRGDSGAGIADLPQPPQALRPVDGGNPSPAAMSVDQTTDRGPVLAVADAAGQPARLPDHDMSVVALGRVLYTRYLWTIELAGTLLLVAACGAILIAQRDSGDTQTGVPAR